MRIVHSDEIIGAVEALCIQACRQLPGDVASAMHCAANQEPFAPARMILSQLVENAEAAAQNQMPICQDTGMAWVMVELGQEVHLEGMLLKDAVDEGVRRGYTKGYLRKSVVADPLRRVNTLDNTPALLHVEMVPGDAVTITLAPKGFGSENMSGLKMLTPSAGAKGVKDFVVDTVRRAGGNPCPPIVVGVGIGGSFDRVALLAKKALLLPLGSAQPRSLLCGDGTGTVIAYQPIGHWASGVWRTDHGTSRKDTGIPHPYCRAACGGEYQLPCSAPCTGCAVKEKTMEIKQIHTPLTEDQIKGLKAGDQVRISGTIYTARDAAHAKMAEALEKGQPLPMELEGALIYYAGPTPAKPGMPGWAAWALRQADAWMLLPLGCWPKG